MSTHAVKRPGSDRRGLRLPFALWLLPWLLGAALLWFWAWPAQYQRACWMGEWPFENGCPETPQAGDPENSSVVYLGQLERNVGDSRSWAWLTGALWKENAARAQALLPWTLRLAPHEPQVLAIHADQQLQARNWEQAAGTLITLLERNQREARPALLGMMASEATQAAVLGQLTADSHWLDPLLASLDRQFPLGALLPFVSTGQELGVLKPETVLRLIDRLKREGAWIDAYALWVAWKGEVSAGLFNGHFDRSLTRRGFDWEWVTQPSARRGFNVSQASASPDPGMVLEVGFTGRGSLPQPLVSQLLVLPEPAYVLRGKYMTERLVSKEGLVWALRCAGGGERWASTEPMLETQRQWTTFELRFTPPAECGAAVRLQLETSAPWEARAGMVGTVFFDDFVLESVDAVTPPVARRAAGNARESRR